MLFSDVICIASFEEIRAGVAEDSDQSVKLLGAKDEGTTSFRTLVNIYLRVDTS
jgi:hypothetical protein